MTKPATNQQAKVSGQTPARAFAAHVHSTANISLTQYIMMTKIFILITVLALASCWQDARLPDKFKTGLLDFKVKKSTAIEQIENGNLLDMGALWTGFNRMNIRTNQDTLTIDVNIELSTPLNYDGGYEVARDTLFLFAKRLDKADAKENIHSTLTYKISSKGLTYKEIEFKELN